MVVYLCRGSDCEKRKLTRRTLESHCPGAEIVKVGCQKVCKSPVVGVDLGHGPRWFRKMNDAKALDALQRYIETGKLESRLEAKEFKKRAGRLRT